MLEIKKITNSKIPNYLNLFFDNDIFHRIHIDIVNKYNLRIGTKLDDEKLKSIISDNSKIECYKYAINLISKKLRTEKELIAKLKLKQYDDNVINEIISRLKELNYINDNIYSKKYIEILSKKKGFGLTRIKKELLKKGIKKEIINEVLNDEIKLEMNYELIKNQLKKKLKLLEKKDINKKKNSLLLFLKSKGIPSNKAFELINELLS